MAMSKQTILADRVVRMVTGTPAVGTKKAQPGLKGAHLRFVIDQIQSYELELQKADAVPFPAPRTGAEA